jgi:MAF protein
MPQYQLILASTSTYRASILKKIGLPFTAVAPTCDETPLAGETAAQLVLRLASNKAQSCSPSNQQDQALIIGSDQVCVIDDQIIGKPHTHQRAVQQLQRQSGRSITFYTGLAIYNQRTGLTQTKLDSFVVHFRDLSQQQIEYYVATEQPFNCAGSFKSEGFGISLFHSLEGKDPNTLIGLPLIDLIEMLHSLGVDVLSPTPLDYLE